MPTTPSHQTRPIIVQGLENGKAGSKCNGTGPMLGFACPFYKLNPHMYDECKKFQFRRIYDVKQHLFRRHSLKVSNFVCTTCWSDCPDAQTLRDHHLHGGCQARARPEELTSNEVHQLRVRQPGDGPSQWFAIWSQLFSGHAAPNSPYIHPSSIQEVSSLIYPTIEARLHADFPSLQEQLPQLQVNNSEAKLLSFVKAVVGNASHDFCQGLPTSRHRALRGSSSLPVGMPNHSEHLGLGEMQPKTNFHPATPDSLSLVDIMGYSVNPTPGSAPTQLESPGDAFFSAPSYVASQFNIESAHDHGDYFQDTIRGNRNYETQLEYL